MKIRQAGPAVASPALRTTQTQRSTSHYSAMRRFTQVLACLLIRRVRARAERRRNACRTRISQAAPKPLPRQPAGTAQRHFGWQKFVRSALRIWVSRMRWPTTQAAKVTPGRWISDQGWSPWQVNGGDAATMGLEPSLVAAKLFIALPCGALAALAGR
jgi:hypothetical protein